MEAYWKCGAAPVKSASFFSPWFGIETSDNLNLLQPVNPWTGSQWEIYNEYYQWSPTHNENSASHVVSPGDVLYGSVTLDEASQSYMLYHEDIDSGWKVNMSVPIQKSGSSYKNYTIIYIVYEKKAPCKDYPPDGQVTFYDIRVDYEGTTVTDKVKWTTAYVDDVCNNRAKIINSTAVQITWDTSFDDSNTPVVKPVHGLDEGRVSAGEEGMAYREN